MEIKKLIVEKCISLLGGADCLTDELNNVIIDKYDNDFGYSIDIKQLSGFEHRGVHITVIYEHIDIFNLESSTLERFNNSKEVLELINKISNF